MGMRQRRGNVVGGTWLWRRTALCGNLALALATLGKLLYKPQFPPTS